MKFKQIAKKFLPPIVFDTMRWVTDRENKSNDDKVSQQYLCGGRVPWSAGYDIYKSRFITQTLADETLLARFRHGESLPSGYGVGIGERCVEYPWLLSHLRSGPECILDAGSTLNHAFMLDHSLFQGKKLHIPTLAPESDCFWYKGVSYLYDHGF